MGKVDWNLNERHHLSGYYFDSRTTQLTGGAIQPYWNVAGYSKTVVMAGGWTWIANSSLVNDLRVGWGGSTGSSAPGDIGKLASDPWPKGYGLNTGVTNPLSGGFPLLTIGGSGGGGGGGTTAGIVDGLGVPGTTGVRGPQGQLNIKDTVSYLRGNHAFKFGFEHVWVKFDNSTTTDSRGSINFPSLTAFLQGIPDSGFLRTNVQLEYDRARWYAAFVQDTWRISPRLTLTPGLRYEYQGAPFDKFGHLGTFDPNAPGGVVQVASGLPHSKLYNPEKAFFMPRFGAAWDILGTGRTVLRGGVSLMSGTIPMTGVTQQTPFGSSFPEVGIDRSGTEISTVAPQQVAFAPSDPVNFANFLSSWNTTGPIFPTSGATTPSCFAAAPCITGAPDPNYKRPKAVEWNLDLQHAITNNLTIDVAYVGNHGYDEFGQVDLNGVPVGTGWTLASGSWGTCTLKPVPTPKATTPHSSACKPDATAIKNARPYNLIFPYLSYIERSTGSLGIFSNYNGLQVTIDQRNFHGLSFLGAYTYSHALDISSSVSRGVRQMIDPSNPRLQYGSGDNDLRHSFRWSPTWLVPGIKTPGQMLEGWSVSGILSLQGRFPYSALDNRKNDFIGTGETSNTFVSSGVTQFWNYSGPGDAFNSSAIPIPCYPPGRLAGCTAMNWVTPTTALQAIRDVCQGAAQAPYAGNPTLQQLALLSLANNGCYIQNGGVLTPPAYGTIGNAGKNSFRGPQYRNVDMSIAKDWHIGERYSAQFRVEFFNIFNHPNFGSPGSSPTSGGNSFGFSKATPDASNAVLGTGGPRHIQFGLKLAF